MHLGEPTILLATPEGELLVSCVRLRTDSAGRETVTQLVKHDLSWDYVVRASIENRVSSLLYGNLRRAENAAPRDTMSRLRKVHIHTIAHNLRTHSELVKILRALESTGIEVMLLKGAALESILGQNMYPRPMSDIDILVSEHDFRGVREILFGLGYFLSRTLPDLSEREIVEYAHYFDQIKFFDPKGMKIDSHFRLINMGIPPADERIVWRRSVRVKVGGASALVPSVEDMLLHLCFHANHHRFAKLYYFCDIDRLLEHCAGTFDWEYFVEASGRRHMRASMYYAMLLANRLLGSSVPATVLEGLKPRIKKRVLFEIVWLRSMGVRNGRLRLGRLEGPIYSLLEMDGLKSKAKFARKILFPPRKWLSQHYGRRESIVLSFKYLLELLIRCRRAIWYETH